jgi:hypothetical protein
MASEAGHSDDAWMSSDGQSTVNVMPKTLTLHRTRLIQASTKV